MAVVNTIESNVSGLRYQEELAGCIGDANVLNDWIALEPNSYDSFGGEFTTVARDPINQGRQRQKGVLVDLDATGGFQSDITQNNLEDILQGYFFADLRRKNDVGVDRQPRRTGLNGEFDDYTITDIDTTSDDITVDSRVAVSAVVVAAGSGYSVDEIVEVTDGNATILARFRISGETGGVVDTVDLVNPDTIADDNDRTVEGRTDTDTSAGAVTTGVSAGFGGDNVLTLTLTYGNGLTWQIGDLLLVAGNTDAANNGLKEVTAVADNVISVAENLVTDATPAAAATMTTVGFQGAGGDIDVDATGTLPTLTGGSLDFTTLGLIPGEWIFIGGDLAAEAFTNVDGNGNSVNNGFARIHTIAAGILELDKTTFTMTTEASTTETIRLFFGRILKNEADPTLQFRRTYQLERTLGAPDGAVPAEIQAEYLEGWVANEMTMNFSTADKVTIDLSGVATDITTVDGPTPLKTGSRPALVSGDAFNTSNDIVRLKLSKLDRTLSSNPTALFAFVTEFSIVLNNNVTPNKAISVLGAFDVTAGQFNVEGSMEAYFADVTALSSIRNNDDITLDFAMVKGTSGAKSGILVDIPLITLGGGQVNVEQNEPITLPLEIPAGADAVFDHTMLMSFYDFLPDRADP